MGWPGEKQRHALSARGVRTEYHKIKKQEKKLTKTRYIKDKVDVIASIGRVKNETNEVYVDIRSFGAVKKELERQKSKLGIQDITMTNPVTGTYIVKFKNNTFVKVEFSFPSVIDIG